MYISERNPSLLLTDIFQCIEHIQLYTHNLSFDQFTINYMVIEACLYNLQVIGEVVSKLPEEIKEKNSGIPWSLIKGMRNRLIHQYFGTDLQLVWNVIQNELPQFKVDLEAIQDLLNK